MNILGLEEYRNRRQTGQKKEYKQRSMCVAQSCQAPVSTGFPRQEYWCRLPFPTLGDLLTQGWNPSLLSLLHWQADFFYHCTTWEAQAKKTDIQIHSVDQEWQIIIDVLMQDV